MISLIVAFDQNQLIGVENKMPWHFKEDLQYFKKTTLHHDVLMGRKTFESILSYNNQPLPNRHSVVLSRTIDIEHDAVTVIQDLQEYITNYPSEKELFVIGGASVYEQVLPMANRLYITHVKGTYEGDTYFPAYDSSAFTCIKETATESLVFAVYERKV